MSASASCPTCGDSFNTQRGMKVHHSRSHGEPLADRTCPHCEEPFASRRSEQRYCSRACSEEAKRDQQVKLTCDCCYATFRVRPSFNHLRHCSPRCKSIAQRFHFGPDNIRRRLHRPWTLKELVRRAFIYEGHSFEATCRIVDAELDGEYSESEVRDVTDGLLSYERNVRNRLWALRPEDLGLSPMGSRKSATVHDD